MTSPPSPFLLPTGLYGTFPPPPAVYSLEACIHQAVRPEVTPANLFCPDAPPPSARAPFQPIAGGWAAEPIHPRSRTQQQEPCVQQIPP